MPHTSIEQKRAAERAYYWRKRKKKMCYNCTNKAGPYAMCLSCRLKQAKRRRKKYHANKIERKLL